MASNKDYIIIDNWLGGLSDGSRLGIEGSFRFGQGLDYKTTIDSVGANLALEKETGTTVTGLIKWIVKNPSNEWVFFYDDGGKVYRRSSGGFSLLRTVANSGGQGMEIYNDYIYYTQDSQIGRVDMGSVTFTDGWQTGLNGTTEWRPIKAFQNLLCVGNGRYLATWDGSTWTATALTFPPYWWVHDIAVRGDYLAIAVNNANEPEDATRGIVFYWDGTSSTYNFFNEVPEGGGISAIEANQDNVWVFAGHTGNIYLDTGSFTKMKRIPFAQSGKTFYVYPGAVANYRGQIVFGIAGGTDTSVYRGVYEFGQPNKNYPYSLNFAYPISTGTVTGITTEIGAICPVGPQIHVGWRDNTTYGADLSSTSNLQTSVVYESRVIPFHKDSAIKRIKIFAEPLASGEGITIKYKRDRESSWQTDLATFTYAGDGALNVKTIPANFRCTDLEIQLTLSGSASSMPTVHKIIIERDSEDRV